MPSGNNEVRELNRVEIVDALSRYGDTKLIDFIDLNDAQVITRIKELSDEWGHHEDLLFNACNIGRYALNAAKGVRL